MNDLIPFGASGGPILPARNKMIAGQYLQSASGQYQLILHEDANLVLKDNGGIIWVANNRQRYSRYYKVKRFDHPAVVMHEYLQVHQPAQKRYWSAVGYGTHGNNHQAGRQRVFAVLGGGKIQRFIFKLLVQGVREDNSVRYDGKSKVKQC